MNSLLSKLMVLLIGITIIAATIVFNYLKQTNKNKILERKFQELNIDRVIINDNLNLLYKTISSAYAPKTKNFKKIIDVTKSRFIYNMRNNDIFKSEGFLLRDGNKVYIIYGDNVSEFFKVKLFEDSINKLEVGNDIYYVSYLKFSPFNIEILFYDTKSLIDKEILNATLTSFKIAIIFIILILFIVFVFIKFIILQPISELIETISQVSKNKYQYITQFYTTKEFNLVKEYFNHMIDAIKAKEEKIKSYLKDQEKRELFYYDVLNSQENIIIVNDTKKIEHVNDGFFRFFEEYNTLEDFLKNHKCICDFFIKEDGYIYDFEDKNWLDFLIEYQDKAHKVKIIKNKKEYIFNIVAKKLRYSDKVIITLNNITSLEEEKEKVLELNRLLEDYKNAIDAGIIVSKTDKKGIITYVNDEFCKISGYSKEELIGKSHNIVRHPDVSKEIYKDLWGTIEKGKIWKGELKNRKKDGNEYYVNTIVAPLMNKNKEIVEYIALREDITNLVYAIKKAQEAEQVKMRFLSNMSHEIRTPLNGILGFTDLLLKSNNLPKKEQKYLNIVHSSSQALLQIINDVLDISKIESGKLTLEIKSFKPVVSFKQAAELFKAKAKSKNIDLKIDLDFNLAEYIVSDEFRIRQVISNLIGNAIKFTPENGEIIFSVKQIKRKGEISTLYFSIKDNGIGIPKDKQKDIFKEFTQADNSVSRKFGGTGLGLTISKNIVKALGGDLRVKSEENKGSEFYFCIDVESSENSIKDLIKNLNIVIYKIENKKLIEYLKQISNLKDDFAQADLILSSEYLEEYKDKLVLFGSDKTDIYIPKDFDSSDILNVLFDFIERKEEISNLKTDISSKVKILVAEDNEVNQELIKILLDTKKLDYKIVNDGIEAIESYKREKFDLIFMDINMPKMDGIQATKEIKKYELENNLKHIPIIALTANAMDGDKDKFLKIMDNYLSKPIIEEELDKILKNYLKKEKFSKEEIIKKLGIPITIFDKVLEKFLETIDSYMDDLAIAIKSDKLDDIRYHAHKIKGSMMTFHLNDMVEILQYIEEDAKNKIKRDYQKDFEKIKKELEIFKDNIKG